MTQKRKDISTTQEYGLMLGRNLLDQETRVYERITLR